MTRKLRYTKDSFFSPLSKYYGEFTLGNLLFNANLQEFDRQVSSICNLVENGEMNSEDAYEKIEKIWQEFKNSKKELLDKLTTPPTNF